MSKYLVTGAGGFIGSMVAQQLLKNGYEVVTVDNLSTGFEEAVPNGAEFIKGHCQDQNVIDELRQHQFEAIYHIAGQSSGEVSFEDPVYDLQTNAQSTLQLLELCRDTGCQKFIYASSMSVYGDVADESIHEAHSAKPKSFYAVGKLASEHYLRIYSENFNLATTALRLFNVYGPGQNLENMKQGMVSIFLAQALENGHIHVKGSKDRFRDLVYIDDVVNAFLLAEDKLIKGQNEILNVCTGKKTKVATLVNQIRDSIGGGITAWYEGHTPGDQFGIYGDHSAIRKKWGWTPQVDLNEGIDRMVQWAKTSV